MLAKLPSEYESRGIIRALRGYVYLYKSKSEESVAIGRDACAMQPNPLRFRPVPPEDMKRRRFCTSSILAQSLLHHSFACSLFM